MCTGRSSANVGRLYSARSSLSPESPPAHYNARRFLSLLPGHLSARPTVRMVWSLRSVCASAIVRPTPAGGSPDPQRPLAPLAVRAVLRFAASRALGQAARLLARCRPHPCVHSPAVLRHCYRQTCGRSGGQRQACQAAPQVACRAPAGRSTIRGGDRLAARWRGQSDIVPSRQPARHLAGWRGGGGRAAGDAVVHLKPTAIAARPEGTSWHATCRARRLEPARWPL